MKALVYAIFGFFIIAGCKKDEPQSPGPLKAGALDAAMNSVTPPSPLFLTVKRSCLAADSTLCTWARNQMPLDLNGDNSIDVNFYSSRLSTTLAWGPELTVYTTPNLSFCQRPLKEGDLIDEKLTWVVPKQGYGLVGTPTEHHLAYFFSSWSKPAGEAKNEWEYPAYLAIRSVVNGRTTYGWVKLRIADYNKLFVYSWGMQK